VLACYGARIQVIHQENRGQGAAFDTGFEPADGDAALSLDADDELRPGTTGAVQAANV